MREELYEKLKERLELWYNSQEDQTDGYEYERSFVELWRRLGQEVLQESMGDLPRSRNQKKKIKTTFGWIESPKTHLMSETAHGFQMSRYLQDRVCYVGQNEVYEEGSECLQEMLGVEVSSMQIERVCHCYGELLEEDALDKGVLDKHKASKSSEVLYGMVDGSMLLTREESWKELKLGRIFGEDSHVLLSKGRKQITDSVYTSHLGGYKEFLAKWEDEIPKDVKQLILLADGVKWFWEWADSKYPCAIKILDYYHCKQYLGEFAKVYFKHEAEKEKWIEKQEALLFKDKIEEVICNIEGLNKLGVLYTIAKEKILTYFQNNKSRMLYGTYTKLGLLIGSGPIEAAHRNVIQKRLKLAGQRWTKKGAQYIANLRTCRKSNRWTQIIKLTKPNKKAA